MDGRLVLVTLLGIAFLAGLVIKDKLQAFVALLLTSAAVGVAASLPLVKVIESKEVGMGDTLGFVAIVVGLGAMFEKMLECLAERNNWPAPSSIALGRTGPRCASS
jgi:Gnt-I system low-affinity gluconate transporter